MGVQGWAKWLPPPVGVAKLNVDAALSKNENKATVAAIARDENGSFLGASVLVVDEGCDPEVLEAAACREGLALASDLNLHRLRVASDCVNAVNAINKGVELLWTADQGGECYGEGLPRC
jgi:ribonuclease HI